MERVSSFDDLLVNTVRSVACRRWFSGRLVLLGDAAHAMPPNLGQGANSALVDSLVLAEELARAPSVMDALVGYDKRRRPLARRVQKTAEMLQRLCGIERVAPCGKGRSVAGLARFPRLSEEAIRGPGRGRRNCQIGIPARRCPLSPPRESRSFGSRSIAPVADLENTGRQSGIAALLERMPQAYRLGSVRGHGRTVSAHASRRRRDGHRRGKCRAVVAVAREVVRLAAVDIEHARPDAGISAAHK